MIDFFTYFIYCALLLVLIFLANLRNYKNHNGHLYIVKNNFKIEHIVKDYKDNIRGIISTQIGN